MTAEPSTDQVAGPPDDLRRLGRLIGTRHVTDPRGSGSVEGQVSCECLDEPGGGYDSSMTRIRS